MEVAFQVISYEGPAAGPDELINRGTHDITIPSSSATATGDYATLGLSFGTLGDVVPVISGMVGEANLAADAAGGSIAVIPLLQATQVLMARRTAVAFDTTVSLQFVEFTGSNWEARVGLDLGPSSSEGVGAYAESPLVVAGTVSPTVPLPASGWANALILQNHTYHNNAPGDPTQSVAYREGSARDTFRWRREWSGTGWAPSCSVVWNYNMVVGRGIATLDATVGQHDIDTGFSSSLLHSLLRRFSVRSRLHLGTANAQ